MAIDNDEKEGRKEDYNGRIKRTSNIQLVERTKAKMNVNLRNAKVCVDFRQRPRTEIITAIIHEDADTRRNSATEL